MPDPKPRRQLGFYFTFSAFLLVVVVIWTLGIKNSLTEYQKEEGQNPFSSIVGDIKAFISDVENDYEKNFDDEEKTPEELSPEKLSSVMEKVNAHLEDNALNDAVKCPEKLETTPDEHFEDEYIYRKECLFFDQSPLFDYQISALIKNDLQKGNIKNITNNLEKIFQLEKNELIEWYRFEKEKNKYIVLRNIEKNIFGPIIVVSKEDITATITHPNTNTPASFFFAPDKNNIYEIRILYDNNYSDYEMIYKWDLTNPTKGTIVAEIPEDRTLIDKDEDDQPFIIPETIKITDDTITIHPTSRKKTEDGEYIYAEESIILDR